MQFTITEGVSELLLNVRNKSKHLGEKYFLKGDLY